MYPPDIFRGTLVRLLEAFEGLQIPCVSRVDAAASKLVWASLGSHKSRRDLRRMHGFLLQEDRLELGRLARMLGHTNLLAEILTEPDEISG